VLRVENAREVELADQECPVKVEKPQCVQMHI
jgi:hypothetical protein